MLAAIFAHTDAIVRMMRIDGPVSIGLLEALSLLAWTLAVLACFICIERQNRVLGAILLASAAVGAAATGSGRTYAEENVPGWELTAHILLSMGAAALLFAAAVTALLLFFLEVALRRAGVFTLDAADGSDGAAMAIQTAESFLKMAKDLDAAGDHKRAGDYYLKAHSHFLKARREDEAKRMWERYRLLEERRGA